MGNRKRQFTDANTISHNGSKFNLNASVDYTVRIRNELKSLKRLTYTNVAIYLYRYPFVFFLRCLAQQSPLNLEIFLTRKVQNFKTKTLYHISMRSPFVIKFICGVLPFTSPRRHTTCNRIILIRLLQIDHHLYV